MENEKKPNNFKEAALSHIPDEIIQSMTRQTMVDTSGATTGIEAIAALGGPKLVPQKTDAPQQPKFMSLAIDGRVIKIDRDPNVGAVTMLLYLLATVWSKDKKVKKILKQFNFHFFDENNVQIYPPLKQNGKE